MGPLRAPPQVNSVGATGQVGSLQPSQAREGGTYI